MPSPYTQTSGSVGARGALQEMIMERLKAQAVQREIDQQQVENTQKDRALTLNETQEARMKDFQNKQFEDLAFNREDAQVRGLAEDSMPGDAIDPATAGLIQKHGRGGMLRTLTTPGAKGVTLEATGGQIPGLMGAPPVTGPTNADESALQSTVSRGGSKYLAARTAADERAAQQQTSLDAQNERATADREMRETIARLSASNSASSRALADQLKEMQIKAEQDKLTTSQDARASGAKGLQDSAQETLNTIDQLLDPKTGQLTPGASHIVGPFRRPETLATAPVVGALVGSGGTANAYAAFNRLKARVVVDLLGQMKAQSKTGATGFGQLSEKEGQMLANAAAQLENSQDPEAFRDQLLHMRTLTAKILQPSAATSAAPAPAASGAPPAPAGWKYVPKAGGGWTAVEDAGAR